MLINPGFISGTTSNGELEVNTQYIRGLCRNIIINPASESTTYDVNITNGNDIIVYERLSETGTLSEIIQLPVLGVYTITISDSTKDELFKIQLICEE